MIAIAASLAATSSAQAQVYTWTGATDTNFNNPANYTAGLSFPTSGTLQLTSGTAIPNAPTLTASTTAVRSSSARQMLSHSARRSLLPCSR